MVCGRVILANDHQSVIFQPTQPFTPGEQVAVNSLRLDDQTTYAMLTYSFRVAPHQQPGGVGASTQPANFDNPYQRVLFNLLKVASSQTYVSYRAFGSPWQGAPLTPPALAYQQNGKTLTLGYSWNGATAVAAWKVYGGTSPTALTLIDQMARSGFETQSQLADLPKGECYFQVAPLDANGKEMTRSKVISTDLGVCSVK